MRGLPCVAALALIGSSSVSAVTIHVPADHTTIAAALGAAMPGDTVRVSCGLYEETGLVLPRDVTLLGDPADSSCVVLRCPSPGRPILRREVAFGTNTIRWITFRDGNCTDYGGGGAIRGSGYSTTHISNCRFEGNTANSGGGAVATVSSIRDCVFVGNHARTGGAASSTTMQVVGCTFLRNRATDSGGALHLVSGLVADCILEENVAENHGGGVRVSGNGYARIEDCFFRADSATYGGGLAYNGYTDPARCVFRDNHASLDGGGLYLQSAVVDDWWHDDIVYPVGCASSRFLGNRAERRGGAIAQGLGFGTIRDCSLVGNSSPDAGGYAAARGGRIERCLIEGSPQGAAVTALVPAEYPWVECSDFHANAGGDWTPGLAIYIGFNGNFSADPLLCASSGDSLAVAAASPLLPENNECGVLIGASGAACESPGVVVTTTPPGLTVDVDGVPVVAPAVFDWTEGSFHTVGVPDSVLPGPGVRILFQSWSDGGGATHGVPAPPSPATIRATLDKTYRFTATAGAGGTVTPPTDWHPAQERLLVLAIPDSVHRPAGWVGTGLGSYTGGGTGIALVLGAPISEHASFEYDGTYPVTMIAVGGGTVSPPSGEFHVGDDVEIVAQAPVGYIFDGWVGEGSGSYTGPDATAVIRILGPITQTATFRNVGFVPVVVQAWGGGTVEPASGDYLREAPLGIYAYPSPGFAFHYWGGDGPGSYTGPEQAATIRPMGPVTQTAYFTTGTFPFTITAGPGGVVSPDSGDRAAGAGLSIYATPFSGWRFREWQGTGPGSYSGPLANASVTVHGPITQHAVFEPEETQHGYEFSVSRSATDPFATSGPPTGVPRTLYLWLTCSQLGLSALELGVQSTIPLTEFAPAAGVYNVGSGSDLLLAVAGCPTGNDVAHVLGSWTALDTGGEVCLGPSAANGVFAAVDCGPQPFVWPDPVARGFSSLTPSPCVTGANGCGTPVSLVLSQLEASPGDRRVVLTWTTSFEVNHAGFHVYRGEGMDGPYIRLTPDMLTGRSPHRFEDSTVEADRIYHYKVGAVEVGGHEDLYGPVAVTTPKWAPLETALTGAVPNPFRGETRIRFSLARPGPAKLVIYDVAGRAVASLVDGPLPAGDHSVLWDGRTSTGRAASGIYFARFDAVSKRQTERIVFLGGKR